MLFPLKGYYGHGCSLTCRRQASLYFYRTKSNFFKPAKSATQWEKFEKHKRRNQYNRPLHFPIDFDAYNQVLKHPTNPIKRNTGSRRKYAILYQHVQTFLKSVRLSREHKRDRRIRIKTQRTWRGVDQTRSSKRAVYTALSYRHPLLYALRQRSYFKKRHPIQYSFDKVRSNLEQRRQYSTSTASTPHYPTAMDASMDADIGRTKYEDTISSVESVDLDDSDMERLSPGDFVQVQLVQKKKYLIFLGVVEKLGVFLDARGITYTMSLRSVSFRIPDFTVVNPLDRDILLKQDYNSVEFLEKSRFYSGTLREFVIEFEDLCKSIRRHEISQNIYQHYIKNTQIEDSHKSPIHHSLLRIQDATEFVKKEYLSVETHTRSKILNLPKSQGIKLKRDQIDNRTLNLLGLLVHDILMDDPDRFIATRFGSGLDSTFHLASPTTLAILQRIRHVWDHEPQIIDNFVKKINNHFDGKNLFDHPLTQQQYQQPSSSPTTTTTTTETETLKFHRDDRNIIRLIQLFIESNQKVQYSLANTVVPSILKRIKGYTTPKVSIIPQCANFLRSISIYTPWQNLSITTSDHDLNKWYNSAFHDKSLPSPPASSSTETTTSTTTTTTSSSTDAHDSVRHDFNTAPVYVIDDIDAHELDDGISVEKDCTHPNTWWIHVHVADPTATLEPNSEHVHNASQRLGSLYLPDSVYNLFPTWLTKSSRWSLGRSGDDKNGDFSFSQRTLTFSTRIDKLGVIYESKVVAGIIRNPKVITYNMLDNLLVPNSGKMENDVEPLLSYGPCPSGNNEATTTRHLSSLNSNDNRNLKKLAELMHAVTLQRTFSGSINFHKPEPTLKVNTIDNELSVNLYYPKVQSNEFSSRDVVAEAMILAGRACAKFANEHGVPVLYRQQVLDEDENKKYQELLIRRSRYGTVNFQTVYDITRRFGGHVMLPKAVNSLTPGVHASMGINDEFGYVRVTSPLRRFSDLVMHWNIKNILLSKRNRLPKSPFCKDYLTDLAHKLTFFESFATLIPKHSTMSYVASLLLHKNSIYQSSCSSSSPASSSTISHGLTDREIDLLGNLKAVILEEGLVSWYDQTTSYRSLIPSLGIEAILLVPTSQITLQPGQTKSVEIFNIMLDTAPKIILSLK